MKAHSLRNATSCRNLPSLIYVSRPSSDYVRGREFQVAAKGEKTLDKIEETQAALRESIESARKLAEQSDRLIRQHRKEMDKE